jgi:hypothetical protein
MSRELPEDIECGQQVQPTHYNPVAQHGVGFAAAGLTVGEAGDPCTIECAVNERSD